MEQGLERTRVGWLGMARSRRLLGLWFWLGIRMGMGLGMAVGSRLVGTRVGLGSVLV